jgi:hypothetical protein
LGLNATGGGHAKCANGSGRESTAL